MTFANDMLTNVSALSVAWHSSSSPLWLNSMTKCETTRLGNKRVKVASVAYHRMTPQRLIPLARDNTVTA